MLNNQIAFLSHYQNELVEKLKIIFGLLFFYKYIQIGLNENMKQNLEVLHECILFLW